MAMHEPCSRIVGGKSDGEPSTSWEHSSVSPGRVVEVQSAGGGISEASGPSTQNVEVVAMKMDWVGNVDGASDGFLDDPVSPLA